MNKTLFKNFIVEVKNTYKKYISLLLVCLLGIGLFVGIKTTSSDMINTLNKYLTDNNVYDIHIESNIGFSDYDLEKIKNIKEIKDVYNAYKVDTLINNEDNSFISRFISIDDVNKTILIDGNYPKNNNEVVVEEDLLNKMNLFIGDEINIEEDSIKENKLKIVGVVNSPIYINNVTGPNNRGITSIGTGIINFYIYTLPSNFNLDYYTDIYITLNNKYDSFSNQYYNNVNSIIKKVNNIEKECTSKQSNKMLSLANDKYENIYDKRKTLNKNINDMKKLIDKYHSSFSDNVSDYLNISMKYDTLLKKYNIKESEIESEIKKYKSIDSSISNNKLIIDELELMKKYRDKYKDLDIKKIISDFTKLSDNYALAKTSYSKINSIIYNIENPEWKISQRIDDNGYSNYVESTKSISNLSYIFSGILFIVSIMVCYIIITKMIIEDRREIGILKSLGYSKRDIRKKYIYYSLSISLIGGIIGSILGSLFIPKLIWNSYKILFNISNIIISYNYLHIIEGILILICILYITTRLLIKKIISENTVGLLRTSISEPNNILNNKYVNKLKFQNKIAIKTLFRNKRRIIYSVFCIALSSILLTIGYGIKDSISYFPFGHYDDIYVYDFQIYTKDISSDNDEILKDYAVEDTLKTRLMTTKINDNETNILVIENKDNIQDFLIYKSKDGKNIKLSNNGVIISSKLAKLLNKNMGDSITFTLDNKEYTFVIENIFKNYANHYIVMTKDLYTKEIDEFYSNMQLTNLKNYRHVDIAKKRILSNENVYYLVYSNEAVEFLNNLVKPINSLSIVLIIISTVLVLVTLYCLNNSFIEENKRQIMVFKLLGYNNIEIEKYLNKGSTFITLFSIFIGILFGYLLLPIILGYIEIPRLYFYRYISLYSIWYIFIILIVFSALNILLLRKNIKKLSISKNIKIIKFID